MTGDNGINRRGQKVECIAQFEVVTHTNRPIAVPEPGKVYTVEDFILSGKVVYGDDDNVPGVAAPGISLRELPIPTCECCGQTLGWPIVGFRPIVHPDAKADLSAIVDAAAKVTLPKREDVKATDQAKAIIVHGGAVLRTLREQRAALAGDRPGEAVMTPAQVAVMNSTVDKAADEITREFVRTFVMPWLVKRLGL